MDNLETYLAALRIRLDATRVWLDAIKVKYGLTL